MSAPVQSGQADEQGFTVLELMVVVLIIAILLAIAIPTYLGSRTRAQDKAAQSKVRTALLAEMIFYTDDQQFTEDVNELSSVDSSQSYTQVLAAMTPAGSVVYVELLPDTLTPGDSVLLGARSASGTCFWARRIVASGSTFATNDCAAAPGAGDFTAAW